MNGKKMKLRPISSPNRSGYPAAKLGQAWPDSAGARSMSGE